MKKLIKNLDIIEIILIVMFTVLCFIEGCLKFNFGGILIIILTCFLVFISIYKSLKS